MSEQSKPDYGIADVVAAEDAKTLDVLRAAASPSGRAVRKNAGRPMIASMVGRGAVEAIARAGAVGLIKYRLDGYREDGGYSLRQCLDSCLRHIFARTSGERYDPDATALMRTVQPDHPGVDHLDLAIWNLNAACENYRLYGDAVDDCWKGPATKK